MTNAQAGQNNDITALRDLRRAPIITAMPPAVTNAIKLTDPTTGAVYAYNPSTTAWDIPLHVSVATAPSLTTADATAASLGVPLEIDADVSISADTTLTAPLVRFNGGSITYGAHNLTIPKAVGDPTPWVAPGGTGTLQVTRPERLTLEAMGAVGDGATSDTAAINRAIAALPAYGGTIYALNAQYLIDETIVITKSIRLVGCGFDAQPPGGSPNAATQFIKSQLLNGPAFQIGVVTSTSVTSVADIILENFALIGKTGNVGDGISIISGPRTTLLNISVHSMGGHGIRGGVDSAPMPISSNCCQLTNVHVNANTGCGLYIHDPVHGGPNVNGWVVSGLYTENNQQDGLYVGTANFNTFINVVTESNNGWGINADSAKLCVFLGGDYNESQTSQIFRFGASSAQNLVLGGAVGTGVTDQSTATPKTNAYFYSDGSTLGHAINGLYRAIFTRNYANYIWADDAAGYLLFGASGEPHGLSYAHLAIGQASGIHKGVVVGRATDDANGIVGYISFFGAPLVTMQTPASNTSGGTDHTGGIAVQRDTTFTGTSGNGTPAYTIGDIVTALKAYGLLA